MSEGPNNFDPRVAVAKLPQPVYPTPGEKGDVVFDNLLRLADMLGWSDDHGPFGRLIDDGARVLIKPNFVLHRNEGGWGMDPMVTHQSVVQASVAGALLASPGEVIVGDAPIQSCDFDELLRVTNLQSWAAELTQRDPRFKGIRDFRRTTCEYVDGVRVASENLLPEDLFVLFDLGDESLLESITDQSERFRVTCYDPRLMAKTHAPGRHQYLVAKDVMQADIVINLPKLKTHKKAGVTCALKNLIGINGNKEYLPHHRLGGANLGGDCYPGNSKVKRMLEYAADRQNYANSRMVGRVWGNVATQLNRVLHLMGDNLGIEGSWSGNDTIWRTALDLNRILLYGRVDGSMANSPQRKVIHVVDAVVAGQGDGPLAPQPLNLGFLFGGCNAAAIDAIGAEMLGYDTQQISIVREAFGDFRWPLTSFAKDDVELLGDWKHEVVCDNILYPAGWADAKYRRAVRAGV